MKTTVIVAGMLILVFYVIGRMATNESVKNNPPVACQFLGGHWTIWDGWQCG